MVEGAFQGIRLSGTEPDLSPDFEILKGKMSQLFQVAEFVKACARLLPELTGTAGTGLNFAKIRMTNREILAEVAYSSADLAVGITGDRTGVGINLR